MRGADELIREVLRSGPKKPKDLYRECINRGLKRATYYRQLRKMIKLGEIEDAKYELIIELEEADPQDVADHINVLKSSSSDEARIVRAKELVRLCRRRASHIPGLLDFFETSLDDPCMEVRALLVSALYRLIETEREHRPLDKKILQRIIENIETVKKLVLRDPNIKLRKGAIDFLRVAGDIRGLDPIFQILQTCDEQTYTQIKNDLAAALFSNRSYLSKNHKREIWRRIDKLVADTNMKIRNRVEELLEIRNEFH